MILSPEDAVLRSRSTDGVLNNFFVARFPLMRGEVERFTLMAGVRAVLFDGRYPYVLVTSEMLEKIKRGEHPLTKELNWFKVGAVDQECCPRVMWRERGHTFTTLVSYTDYLKRPVDIPDHGNWFLLYEKSGITVLASSVVIPGVGVRGEIDPAYVVSIYDRFFNIKANGVE